MSRYDGEHSVTFQSSDGTVNVNSWTDLKLIPSSVPVIAAPSPNFKTVEIPGRDDPIDLSTFLTGRLTFARRSGTLKFISDPDDREQIEYSEFTLYTKLMTLFTGKEMKLIFSDDPEWYYIGNVTVGAMTPNRNYYQYQMSLDLNPYKKSCSSTDSPVYYWNTFYFGPVGQGATSKQGSVVQSYRNIELTANFTEYPIVGGHEPTYARYLIHPGENLTVQVKPATQNSWSGAYSSHTWSNTGTSDAWFYDTSDILEYGSNTVRVKGSGTLRIHYVRGEF